MSRTVTETAPGQTPANFDWPLADAAEEFLRRKLSEFLEKNAFARRLAQRMRDETGTDFFEWIDHLFLPEAEESSLVAAGFVRDFAVETPAGFRVFEHSRATLPRVLIGAGPFTVALKPEFVADFAARQGVPREPEGKPLSRYRSLLVAGENGTRLEAVERRAYRGFVPAPLSPGEREAIIEARQLWQARPRLFDRETAGFEHLNATLGRVLGLVSPELACQFFFEAERTYWESRNYAARLQKQRQDALGLGWGNHDHHTFRCSRAHFVDLIALLMQLGFQKRERYYAGAEAGWGAQILEHPVTGIVVFADVDLLPDETHIDFSTARLPAPSRLGTVGLWVGLHGESVLEAGMHHLEARFDFEQLRDQLQGRGVNLMNPFSDFPFLRQAFTEGERWPVRRPRSERLLRAGLISREQFERFVTEGALGSHLENLQRHGGFKGFNQKSVSVVIAATDPRKAHFPPAPTSA
jgi:hypothetical protein